MDKIIEREITIEAVAENYQQVKDFVRENLAAAGGDETVIMQACMAAEEIFTNIAYYAYDSDGADGKELTEAEKTAVIRLTADPDKKELLLVFMDGGLRYDPLSREDPDITAPTRQRQVGGLGIFMTKQVMDEVSYEYRDGKNVLSMKKHWD